MSPRPAYSFVIGAALPRISSKKQNASPTPYSRRSSEQNGVQFSSVFYRDARKIGALEHNQGQRDEIYWPCAQDGGSPISTTPLPPSFGLQPDASLQTPQFSSYLIARSDVRLVCANQRKFLVVFKGPRGQSTMYA
jgi:hypothetical protein